MPWLSGIFGDDAGFVVTCGLVDAYLASLPSSDDTCKGLQYVSSYYGCPALPNHCRMCNGEDLKPEYAQKEFPLLTSKEAGITGTCKLFWAAQYQIPGGSVDCEVTTIFTHSCGCNDGLFPYMGTSNTTQQAALVWIPRVMGLISLVASVLVLHHIVRNKQKRKVYHHMMILIAAFDIVTSLVWMVGAVAVEKYFRDTDHPLGIYGAHGNSASCIASGFFFQLGNTSIFLNVSLTMYFYLIVVKNLREHQLKSIRFWLLGPPLIFGVGLSFAVIPFVQPSFTLCTVESYPLPRHLWSLLLFLVLPIMLSTLVILVLLFVIYLNCRRKLQVRDTKRKQANACQQFRWSLQTISSKRPRLETVQELNAPIQQQDRWLKRILGSMPSRSAAQEHNNQRVATKEWLEREVFWQCVAYATVFILTWPAILFGQFQGGNFDMSYWLFVYIFLVGPMQGLNNALCYFRPYRKNGRRVAQREEASPSPEISQNSVLDIHDSSGDGDAVIDPAVELANSDTIISTQPEINYFCEDEQEDPTERQDDSNDPA